MEKIEYFSKVLNRVANRESTSQFYDKFPTSDEQYYQGRQEVSNQDYLGLITGYDKENGCVVLVERNYFEPGTDEYYNRKANTSSANTIGNDTGRTSRGIECYPAGAIELGERC